MLGCCGSITNPFCLLPEFSEVVEQTLLINRDMLVFLDDETTIPNEVLLSSGL